MNFSAQGTITKVYLQEIQNKAKGGESRYESHIEVKVERVDDILQFEKFAGKPELVDKYQVGQKVKIVATTSSGRHIDSIEVLEE